MNWRLLSGRRTRRFLSIPLRAGVGIEGRAIACDRIVSEGHNLIEVPVLVSARPDWSVSKGRLRLPS